ncbi:hypothetical protein B0H14DRAFT_2857442, partial [Mycena olivaceomarginata]
MLRSSEAGIDSAKRASGASEDARLCRTDGGVAEDRGECALAPSLYLICGRARVGNLKPYTQMGAASDRGEREKGRCGTSKRRCGRDALTAGTWGLEWGQYTTRACFQANDKPSPRPLDLQKGGSKVRAPRIMKILTYSFPNEAELDSGLEL